MNHRFPTAILLLILVALPAAADVISSDEVRRSLETVDAFVKDAPLADGEWHDDVYVLPYTFGDTYDRDVAGQFNIAPRQWVAQSFFDDNPDHYDFLVVFTNFDFDSGEAVAFFHATSNDVSGIGRELFDFSQAYDSERLQGYVDAKRLADYVREDGALDPSRVERILNHELGHRWLAFTTFDDGGTPSQALLGRDGSHWSYLLDSEASYMYGADWSANGDGSFTATAAFRRYSPLDLYLMGFFQPVEVPPMKLLVNPAVSAAQLPQLGATIEATATTVTVDQIIAAEGARLPTAAGSQHEYRVAFIFLVDPAVPYFLEELEALEEARNLWQRSFFRQTRGRGVVDVARHGEPPLGGSDVDLQRAIEWLVAQAGVSGLWRDSTLTAARDTAEAVEALGRAGGQFAPVADALAALPTAPAASAELRSRRLEALARWGAGGTSGLADALVAEESTSGGWPAFARYTGDAVTTARAVRALAAAGRPEAASGWVWLEASQNVDGGWGWQPGSPSSVPVTHEVLLAARALMPAGFWTLPEVEAGVAWLLAGRAGSGFGDVVPNVSQTALFLQLALDQDVDPGVVQNAVDYLAAHQREDGSWQSSTYKTALAIQALAAFALPDPMVDPSEVFTDPETPFDDEAVSLVAAVRNGGVDLFASVPYAWEVYLANDPAIPLQVIHGLVPLLPSGGFTTVTDVLAPGLAPGYYEIRLVIDPLHELSDRSRQNNTASIPLRIYSHPAGIELALDDADVAAAPPEIVAMPQPVTVSGMLRNRGLTAAAGAVVAVFDGDPAAGSLLGTTSVDVPALDAAPFAVPVILGEARPHLLTVMADPDDLLGEVDRLNNEASLWLPLRHTTDLEIPPVSFSATPDTVMVGEPMTLEATVRNGGTTTAADFQVEFRYLIGEPPVSHLIALLTVTEAVPPDGSVTVATVWAPNVGGDPLTVSVEVDPLGNLGDREPEDNRATAEVTVITSVLPNLRVTPEDLAFNPDPPLQGQVAQVTATISNPTINDAAAFGAELWLDEVGSGTLLASGSFAGLAAGASIDLVAPWDVDEPTDRLVHAVVDAAGAVEEFNEADNQAFAVVDVFTLPDLALAGGAVTVTPEFPRAGDAVHFEVLVANQGDQPSPASVLELLDAAGTVVDSAAIPPMTGHSEVSLGLDWTSDAPGGAVMTVRANPQQTFHELSANNNSVEIILGIQDADLFVTDQIFSPNGDGLKDTATIFFRNGAATVEIADDAGERVRILEVPAGAASVVWDGTTDSGDLARDALYQVRAEELDTWVAVDNNLIAVTSDVEQRLLTGTILPPAGGSFLTSKIMNPVLEELYLVARTGSWPEERYALIRWSGGDIVEIGEIGQYPAFNRPEVLSSNAAGDKFTIEDVWRDYLLLSFPGPVVESLSPPAAFGFDPSLVPRLSPDGRWILWVSSSQESVVLEDLENPGVTYTFDAGPFAGYGVCGSSVVWSRQGNAVVSIHTWANAGYFYEISPGDPPSARVEWAEGWELGCWHSGPHAAVDFERQRLTWMSPAYDSNFSLTPEIAVFDLVDGSLIETGTVVEPAQWGGDVEQPDFSLSNDGSTVAYMARLLSRPPPRLFEQTLANWRSGAARSLPMLLGSGLWSPQGKYLLTAPTWFNGGDLAYLTPAANLTAQMTPQVLPGDAGIDLWAAATDRYLDRYVLEYANLDDDPSAYSPIGLPSDEPLYGERWGTWIPPGNSTYRIRLTASDLAGNVRVASRRVIWNGDNDIANLYPENRYVSPLSSPGIKDAFVFHYTVLRPANLVFQVTGLDGGLILEIPVAADQPGPRTTTWNGEDAAGNPVPDGQYLLTYGDASWPVTVDNTPPEVILRIEDSELVTDSTQEKNLLVNEIFAAARDDNLEEWWYGGRRPGEDHWGRSASGSTPFERDDQEPWKVVGASRLVQRELRITARDLAGNETVSVASYRDEQLLVTDSEPLCRSQLEPCIYPDRPHLEAVDGEDGYAYDAGGFFADSPYGLHPFYDTLLVQSTAWIADRHPPGSLELEYREAGVGGQPAGPWQPGAVQVSPFSARRGVCTFEVAGADPTGPCLQVADSATLLYWDHPGLPMVAYDVRLRVVNDDGQVILSDPLLFQPERPLLLEYLGVGADGDRFRVTNAADSVITAVRLEVVSFGDVLASEPFADQLGPGEVLELSTGCELLDEREHLIRASGLGNLGENAVSLPVQLLPVGSSTLRADFSPSSCINGSQLGSGFFFLECFFGPPPPSWAPSWTSSGVPHTITGSFPADPTGAVIEYYEVLVDGVPYLQVAGPHGSYQEVLDLSQIAEGAHIVSERYVYAGEAGLLGQCPNSSNLFIDRTPPQVEVATPGDGEVVCPGDLEVDLAVTESGNAHHRILLDPRWWSDGTLRDAQAVGGDPSCAAYPLPSGTYTIGVQEPGPHELFVRVTDEAGNSTCTSIEVLVGVPQISLAVTPTVFSPLNTLDRPAFEEILFTVATPGTYTAEVTDVFDAVLYSETGAVSDVDEELAIAWGGTDALGTLMPDGRYRARVSASSPCGERTARATFELDTTPPELIVTAPVAGAVIGSSLEIKGLARDAHFERYELQILELANPTGWLTLHTGWRPTTTADQSLGTWATDGFAAGDYLVRVAANDLPGNQTLSPAIQVTVRPRNFIRRFERQPEIFSPNADGVFDHTEVSYVLIQDAVVTLQVVDAAGDIVATLVDGQWQAASPGGVTVTWAGAADLGGIVPDGAYELVLRAEDPAAPPTLESEEERLSIRVDTVPPELELISPLDESLNGLPLQVVATLTEPHPDAWLLDLVPPDGSREPLAEGRDVFTSRLLRELDDLPDGFYVLDFGATDAAGNAARLPRPFLVDDTAPAVAIFSPSGDTPVNTLSGYLQLEGEVLETHLAGYAWSVAPGDDPQPPDFVVLDQGTGTAANGLVGHQWDASGLADGAYTVRLAAVDEIGRESEARRILIVDNTPPEIELAAPADGAVVADSIDVEGAVQDENLSRWSLELQPDGGAPLAPPLAVGATPTAGTLTTWTTLPADGFYQLILAADDAAGNRSQVSVSVEVRVSAVPPPPVLTSAEVVSLQVVRLEWQPGAGPAPAGYFVYRDGARIHDAPTTDSTATDSGFAEGVYTYTVRAVAAGGAESPDSNSLTVTIDLTAPVAHISAPADGSRVSDLVPIMGTAWQETGLAEWRLEARTLPDGGWTLLASGTAPVLSDVFAAWDTALPQWPDGPLELRLTVEDLAGKLATAAAILEVDNTRPTAPVLTSAYAAAQDPDGVVDDVRIEWSLDPLPPDMAGFYLYRNGVLANAPGPVLGPPQPFLLTGTTYDDRDLPDGTYVYWVTAADTAANESAASGASDPIVIDVRRPHAVIVEPADGSNFDGSVAVTAETPDLDVVSVRFEVMADGAGAWTPLGAPDGDRPYTVVFAPGAHGLYHVRAVASDAQGPDPLPAAIALTETDSAPPEPSNLMLNVDGGTIHLSWPPVADPAGDLAGYRIYRNRDPIEPWTLITPAPLPTDRLSYEDAELADGRYRYYVTAIDDTGLESGPSPERSGWVATPIFDHTAPVTAEATLTLTGSLDLHYSSLELQKLVGADFEPVAVFGVAWGYFSFPPQVLDDGVNVFRYIGGDGYGNRSRMSRELVIIRHDRPESPKELEATTVGQDVTLTWRPSADLDSEGFDIRRSGTLLGRIEQPLLQQPDHQITATTGDAAEWQRVVDGDATTGFMPEPDAVAAGVTWQWTWPNAEFLSAVTPHWGAGARRYSVELRVDGQWPRWVHQTWTPPTPWTHTLGVRATGLRIVIPPDACVGCALNEVTVTTASPTPGPAYADPGLTDGAYRYEVSEINRFGQESERTEVVALVGDQAPVPPSNLQAAAGDCDGEIALSWQPPAPLPGMHLGYRLYRAHGTLAFEPMLDLPPEVTVYLDRDLAFELSYRYRVTTLAQVSGLTVESPPSNPAAAASTCASPPPPELLEPTVAGDPVDWPTHRADVGGRAHPGSLVTLVHGGTPVATKQLEAVRPYETHPLPGYTIWDRLSLAPGGRFATYTYWGADGPNVAVVDLETDRLSIFGANSPSEPAVSSSGDQLAYVGWVEGRSNLFAIDLVTGASAQLTDDAENKRLPAFSPDGRWLAYLSWLPWPSQEAQVKVLDLATGDQTMVFSRPGTHLVALAWSPGGRHLAVETREGPKVIELAGGEIHEILTDAAIRFPATPFSPDGQRLLWREAPLPGPPDPNGTRFRIYDLVDRTASTLSADPRDYIAVFLNDHNLAFLRAGTLADQLIVGRRSLADGTEGVLPGYFERSALPDFLQSAVFSTGDAIWIPQDDRLIELGRASGNFVFPDVALGAGSNFFTARQVLGSDTQDSLPIEIRVAPEIFADAEIEAFHALPGFPLTGDPVLVEGIVRNSGQAVLAGCQVTLSRTSPSGVGETVLTDTLDLPSGETARIRYTWDTAGQTGDTLWRLTLDPADAVAELDEDNNRATLTVPVRPTRGVEVAVEPGRPSYFRGETAVFVATVGANDPPQDTVVTLRVETENGEPVTTVDERSLPAFGYANAELAATWMVDVYPGAYRVRVTATRGGVPVAEATAAFSVAARIAAEVDGSADRPAYTRGESANFLARVRNTGDSTLHGATVRMSVEPMPLGLPVATEERLLPALPAGGLSDVNWAWSASAPAGAYRFAVTVLDAGGAELATAQPYPFVLTAVGADLAGSLSLSPGVLEPGGQITVTAEVANLGDAPLSAIAIQVEIVDPVAGVVHAQLDATRSLAAGEASQIAWTYSPGMTRLRPYVAILTASWVTAGVDVSEQLATSAFRLVDQTPPEVELLEPAAATTCDSQLPIRARVDDQLSGVLRAYYRKDGQPQELPLLLESFAGTVYASQLFLEPIPHSIHLEILAEDIAGNTSAPLAVDVDALNDGAPPVLSISGPGDGACVGAVTAFTYAASDHQLASVTAILDGAPYASGDPIAGDGAHTFELSAEDVCGLASQETREFLIDTVAPVVEVAGVEEGGVYVDEVTLSWNAGDANLTAVSATLDDAPIDTPFTVTEAAPHVLAVSAVDCAGNQTNVEVNFEVISPPIVSVADIEIEEGDHGQIEAGFGVDLTTPSELEVRVDYQTVAGTATTGVDFESVSGTLTFPPGTSAQTVAVPILGDVILEDHETFVLELSNPVEALLGDATAVATILDDETCAGPNLLVNPGAETPLADGQIPGWTRVEGDWRRRFAVPSSGGTVPPADGRAAFFAGTAELAELAQDVDVGAFAARIDADGQAFAFDGLVRTFDEPTPDVVAIVVEYRDASNTVVLDAFDSGEIVSPFSWAAVSDLRLAPAGTGWIRVRLLATRYTGVDNDGYFDALALYSLRAPVVSVDDLTVYEQSGSPPDAETTPADFDLRLSCVFEQPFSSSYSTVDVGGGTAVAGEDYLPISGDLELPVGTTIETVTVPVIGDEVDEPHESVVLELTGSSPEAILVLTPRATAEIRNDDFCARSPGFWKNHTDVWPVRALELADLIYAMAQLEALLDYGGPDAASKLARQLIATKLNLEMGSEPAILPVVDDADLFLAVFPPGSDPRGDDRLLANELKDALDTYNQDDCGP